MAVTKDSKAERHALFMEWFDSLQDEPESLAVQRALEIVLVAEQQRQGQGLTYTQVAKRMGVTKAYVSKLFQGNENSTLVTLCKLAQALGCTLEVRLNPPVVEGTNGAEPAAGAQPASSNGQPKAIPAAAKRRTAKARTA